MDTAAVVTEDKSSLQAVQAALQGAGYVCRSFVSTPALLRGLQREDHTLIVIDIDDRHSDWQTVLKRQRAGFHGAGLVVLIGSASAGGVAEALDAGGDDFVAKPVHGPELLARVQAARRRRAIPQAAPVLVCGGCELDVAARVLRFDRTRIDLTPRETAVAQMLFERPGHIVPRRRLAHEAWGIDEELAGRSIEQHVYQLRRKLKRCAGTRVAIRGVYGSGYRLDQADPRTAEAGPALPLALAGATP